MINRHARETGVDAKVRTFSVTSQKPARAAGGGVGRGRLRVAGDGLPHQQPLVEPGQRLRPVPPPLRHRGVLQAGQTTPEALRLPGPQRQRGALAGLCLAAGIHAAGVHGASFRLGPRFHEALRGGARGGVREVRTCGAREILWDSSGAAQGDRLPQRRVVAGICGRADMIPCNPDGALQKGNSGEERKTRNRLRRKSTR